MGDPDRIVDQERDRAEILDLHHRWLDGHCRPGLVDAGAVVAAGVHIFDLGGRSRPGRTALDGFWAQLPPVPGLVRLTAERRLRLHLHGDAAWVTAEAALVAGDDGDVVMPVRLTEVYLRDDGAGRAEWRLWHAHCSPGRVAISRLGPRLPASGPASRRSGAPAPAR